MFTFLLIVNSLVPIMMITLGLLWKKNPPPGIDWVYGYRRSISMKNNETWKFAHMHNAKIWRGSRCESLAIGFRRYRL